MAGAIGLLGYRGYHAGPLEPARHCMHAGQSYALRYKLGVAQDRQG